MAEQPRTSLNEVQKEHQQRSKIVSNEKTLNEGSRKKLVTIPRVPVDLSDDLLGLFDDLVDQLHDFLFVFTFIALLLIRR